MLFVTSESPKGDKTDGPGYFNDSLDVFVPERKAFDYALERIEHGTQEEKEEFVEWFYRRWFYED